MMRKGVKADSRIKFEELFFDGSFDNPLTESQAGKWKDILEAVRYAPSAVNKQPWRIIVCGDEAHFYEKHHKGFITEDGWDLQKIDMGIALSHFELSAKECGFGVSFGISDPLLPTGENMEYIASYTIR